MFAVPPLLLTDAVLKEWQSGSSEQIMYVAGSEPLPLLWIILPSI